jgi:hypothetical protein
MLDDRLELIKKRLKRNRVYYSSYNPKSDYLHDIEDAADDLMWLVYEVERLREELSSHT